MAELTQPAVALDNDNASSGHGAAIAAKFERLASRWKRETAHLSMAQQRAMHPAYQRVIGMGATVVPLLLRELRREPDDWFWALHAITGENPVPPEAEGRISEMAAAWLEWGAMRGHLS